MDREQRQNLLGVVLNGLSNRTRGIVISLRSNWINDVENLWTILEFIRINRLSFAGGSSGCFLRFFKNNRRSRHHEADGEQEYDLPMPDPSIKVCACGHDIEEQFYVRHLDELIVVGRTCIRYFLMNQSLIHSLNPFPPECKKCFGNYPFGYEHKEVNIKEHVNPNSLLDFNFTGSRMEIDDERIPERQVMTEMKQRELTDFFSKIENEQQSSQTIEDLPENSASKVRYVQLKLAQVKRFEKFVAKPKPWKRFAGGRPLGSKNKQKRNQEVQQGSASTKTVMKTKGISRMH